MCHRTSGGTFRLQAALSQNWWPVVRDTVIVSKRRLSDPTPMAEARPEEVLALKPPGWLVRPFSGEHPGFRMMNPGRMTDGPGTVSVHDPTPEFRSFKIRPHLQVVILNCVLEHPLLVEALSSWSTSFGSSDAPASEIPQLARTTENLIWDNLIAEHEDPLVGAELTVSPQAVRRAVCHRSIQLGAGRGRPDRGRGEPGIHPGHLRTGSARSRGDADPPKPIIDCGLVNFNSLHTLVDIKGSLFVFTAGSAYVQRTPHSDGGASHHHGRRRRTVW